MRSGSVRGLGLMMALGNSLHADWKITTVSTAATGRQIETEYFEDELKRRDFRDGVDGPLRAVSVIDYKNLRDTAWDMKSRQYIVQRLHTALRYEGVSGPVIVIDIETVDTGERRTMFGHIARISSPRSVATRKLAPAPMSGNRAATAGTSIQTRCPWKNAAVLSMCSL